MGWGSVYEEYIETGLFIMENIKHRIVIIKLKKLFSDILEIHCYTCTRNPVILLFISFILNDLKIDLQMVVFVQQIY